MTDISQEKKPVMAGKKRFIILAVCLGIACVAVLARYGYLMLFHENARSGAQRTGAAFGRGPILDRNGRPLALETRLGDIGIWLPDIRNDEGLNRELAESLSFFLAPYLEQSPLDIFTRVVNSHSNYLLLKRQVDESTLRQIEAGISERRLRGVRIDYTVGRIYPERNMASQIIGWVGVDGNGLGGIESALDRELSPGADGGSQVFLTLDMNIQHILENIASAVMRDTGAEAVMFMAMDPRTGDILGSASLPGYDPNNLAGSNSQLRMDRPAIWAYEPGSVFKVFSLAALMDSGAISGNTLFNCNGVYDRVNPGINCLGAHGRVTVRDIIIHSCNAGAAHASDYLGADEFNSYLRAMGFGARTGAGNPGETSGIFRLPEQWTVRSKPTIAIGQELAVSALQMLQAASAIANDGVLVPPRIVSHMVSADNRTLTTYETGQARRIFSPETAGAMREYMMDVTSDIGTAWRANVQDISLAVKTGTAQMTDPLTGRYSATDFIASCIALLPAENPSLVLYLAIVKPRGEILAGRIAAPPIREAAEALINYLGIPRGRNPQIVHPGEIAIPAIIYPIVDESVPDFTNLSKRALQPLLSRDDLQVMIHGDGWVVRQSPPPGTILEEGMLIVLELE